MSYQLYNLYLSKNINIQYFETPYKHIIIDNLFKDKIYDSVVDNFAKIISDKKPYKDTPGATSNYEGIISAFNPLDYNNGYDFFISKDMRQFVANTLDIEFNKFVSISGHLHINPGKPGFIHRDANICSFYDKNTHNDIVLQNCYYTDDSFGYQPKTVKVMRSAAFLYYLNNPISENGGTGIYDGYNGNLLKNILPKNNRLFIFEINHKSYHAFMGSDFDRSAIVGWYHSSPSYIINKYWRVYQKMLKNNQNFIERWSKNPKGGYWPIHKDKNYSKYFSGVNSII